MAFCLDCPTKEYQTSGCKFPLIFKGRAVAPRFTFMVHRGRSYDPPLTGKELADIQENPRSNSFTCIKSRQECHATEFIMEIFPAQAALEPTSLE